MRNNDNLNRVEAVGMERKGKKTWRKYTDRINRCWQWNRARECAKGEVQGLSKGSHLGNRGDIGTIYRNQEDRDRYVEKVCSLLV